MSSQSLPLSVCLCLSDRIHDAGVKICLHGRIMGKCLRFEILYMDKRQREDIYRQVWRVEKVSGRVVMVTIRGRVAETRVDPCDVL